MISIGSVSFKVTSHGISLSVRPLSPRMMPLVHKMQHVFSDYKMTSYGQPPKHMSSGPPPSLNYVYIIVASALSTDRATYGSGSGLPGADQFTCRSITAWGTAGLHLDAARLNLDCTAKTYETDLPSISLSRIALRNSSSWRDICHLFSH